MNIFFLFERVFQRRVRRSETPKFAFVLGLPMNRDTNFFKCFIFVCSK